MANNNADIELLAGLNLDSSEAEILRAIKILEQRIRNNEKAKISIDTKINERAIRTTIDKLQEMLKKKDLKIETKTSIEAISKEADAMLDVMESARRAAEEKLAFADANRRVRESADNTADAINRERNAMNNLDDIDYILDNINMTGQQGNSVFQQFGTTLRDAFSTYTVANLLQDALYKVVDASKEALATVKSFDDINVDLQMATGADKSYVKGLIADYAELGGELGALTDTVAESADSFLRQGRSMEDTNQLIRDSVILSKVAKIDGEKASEILTATINGFQLAASEGSRVNDVLSSIDLNSASDASGIGEALTKVASIANNTGVSLEKTAAMIATIKNATQDADTTIGTSLKTVLSRMNSIRANKFIDEETGEALNDVEKILGAIDVTMRDVNGQFKSAESIIDEVGMKWKDLDSNTQKAVTTAMGGVYQANKLTALFDNYSQVIELTKIAEESQDQALKKFNDSYLPSLEAKTNALKSSLQSLATSTISDEFYGSVLDTTKAIVDMTEESGILKGTLAGLGTAGALFAFQHLATYMRNATQEFANLGEAMQITRNANGTIEDIQRLIDLTGGLSQSQTRLLLSTNNLTDAQKVAILMNQGLTQAEAQQTIQTWGVATAQNGATSATITFSTALRGLWTTLMANPLVLVTTALTVGVTAFNKYKQAQEELVRETKQAADKASELSTEITDLVNKYISLSEAVETDANAKEDLLTTQTELLKKLGLEGESVDELITKYGNLSNAIKQASIDSLKSAQIDLIAGFNVVKEELIDVSKGGFINRNAITASGEDAIKAFGELEKAGLIGSNSYGSGSGYFTLFGDDNTVDGALENFDKLEEALKALRDSDAFTVEELAENPLYKKIYGRYSEIKDEVEAYQSAVDKMNDNYAQILVLGKLQGGAVPKSEDELEKFKQELIDTAVASKQFVGSQKDIEASVINAVSAMAAFNEYSDSVPDVKEDDTSAIPIFSLSENERKALDDYAEKLSLITKLREEWADANASDRMDLMASIAEQFSDFDLSGLESGKQTIEEVLSDLGISALNTVKSQISNYSDELGNMFFEAFGEVNITPYFEEVERLQKLLSEVQSGTVYTFDEISKIVNDSNGELADSIKVVEDGYQLEEDAVISLLNTSITAYNEQVSSARKTTEDIIKARKDLIEVYGIEAEILKGISDLDIYGTSLNYLSDEELKFDYGLTDEQIRRYREYSTLVDSVNLRYNELLETIDDENGSGSSSSNNSIDWLSNSIENLQENIDDLQKAFENTKGFDEQLKALDELTDGLKELQDVYYSTTDNSNTVYGEYESRYKEALGKLGGDASSIQSKIEAGDVFNTQGFSSDVADIINDAIDAWNGMKNAHNKYLELDVEIDDKRLQSYEIQRKPFEANIANLEGEKQKIQNKIDLNGGQGTVEQYKQLIGIEEEIRKSLTERLEMENKILSTLKPNTDEYVEQEQTIRDIENGLDDCAKNTKDWGLELLKLPLREIESVINGLSSQLQSVETEMSEMDAIIAGAQAYIQDQIDAQEELKKPIQEQLDALREANDERERALVLERAKGELDRLLNQNTVKLYNGEQVIYTRDEKAIRDAKENLANLEYEETVRQLEKQLEYYDDIIADLQEVKDKWGNIAQEAEDYLNIQKALGSIGIDGIFDASVIDNFTRSYTKLTQTKDSLDDQISDWEAYQKAIQETVTQYEYGMISFEECQGKLAELTEDFCRKIDEDGKVSAEKISEIVNNILVKFELINVEEKTTKVEQDLSEAEKKTLETTKNMNDSIDDVGENADDTATGVTGTLETETEVQLELMKSFAEEMTATFQSMCDSVVSSTTIAFQSLSANIIATANLVQEQINAMISNSQSGISELEGLLSKASNFNEKYGLSSGNSTPITVSYADDLKINDKFSKGGLITKYDKELDSVAKNMGEDHIAHIAYKEGERILTPAENVLWENWKDISPSLLSNSLSISNVMPKYDITPISRTPQVNIGDVNVTCTGVTSQQVQKQIGDALQREFGGMALKALQVSNRR